MARTDEELVALSVRGDTESFNQLILRWERPILPSRIPVGREEEAVVQETFLRAYRGIRNFRGQAKFSSWIYRIALNLCRDWMRRERRTPVSLCPKRPISPRWRPPRGRPSRSSWSRATI